MPRFFTIGFEAMEGIWTKLEKTMIDSGSESLGSLMFHGPDGLCRQMIHVNRIIHVLPRRSHGLLLIVSP
jgi:hypothetical protein